jgi:hypothetical protein
MRVHHWSDSPLIEYEIGEVVIADMRNFHEDRYALPKNRPTILIRPDRSLFRVVQLTRQKEYTSSEKPRVAIPNWQGLGLNKPAWLWSPSLAPTYRLGIKEHVGWVHHEMIDVLEKHMNLTSDDIRRLREVADRYHP